MEDLTIVFERNNQAVTSSRLVADYFGKRHDTVTRAIENLSCSKEFTRHNFAVSSYKDRSGKKNKMYLMTKDGFTILAMGFTGAKAMQFKEAYIKAFNKMEGLLKGNTTILQLEKRIEALEKANKPFKKVSEESILNDYFTALKQALDSKKYYLRHKSTNETRPGELLGVYDMFTYSIIGQKSYEIYKAFSDNPVHRQALYNLLLNRGYLIPPGEEETKKTKSISIKKVSINHKECRCLVIKRQLVKIPLLN
jgi:Rha family phage regulatory protein